MKRVTRCFGCKKITRKQGAFTAKLEKPEILDGAFVDVVNLCRACAEYAGYKVKTKEVKSNG